MLVFPSFVLSYLNIVFFDFLGCGCVSSCRIGGVCGCMYCFYCVVLDAGIWVVVAVFVVFVFVGVAAVSLVVVEVVLFVVVLWWWW